MKRFSTFAIAFEAKFTVFETKFFCHKFGSKRKRYGSTHLNKQKKNNLKVYERDMAVHT